MRSAVLVALVLFVTAVAVTTVGGRFSPTPRAVATASITPIGAGTTPPGASAAQPASPTPGTSAPASPAPTAAGYAAAEVAKHSTSTDCWIIVDGRVYDVTRYLSQHPAGARTITPWCGKESTVAYETEDGAGTHSSRADRLLESYAIGALRAP